LCGESALGFESSVQVFLRSKQVTSSLTFIPVSKPILMEFQEGTDSPGV
jgi:hypothetical protein